MRYFSYPIYNKEKIQPIKVNHRDNNNKIIESNVIIYDDAFYEIVSGKHKGNLVHRWNIIK